MSGQKQEKIDESELVRRVREEAPEAVRQCAIRRENADFLQPGGGCDAGYCPYQSTHYKVQINGAKLPACMRYHGTLRRTLGLPPAAQELDLTPPQEY